MVEWGMIRRGVAEREGQHLVFNWSNYGHCPVLSVRRSGAKVLFQYRQDRDGTASEGAGQETFKGAYGGLGGEGMVHGGGARCFFSAAGEAGALE